MHIKPERMTDERHMLRWVWHEHLARYEFAVHRVRNKVVVDCACGNGIGSRIFGEAGASKVQAFDISEDAIAVARRENGLPNVHYQVANALHLPLLDSAADIYIAFETIEHLEEDHAFLFEVRRVLKPAGIFICSTPNRTVTNPGKKLADRPWNRFHVREYSHQEMTELLETAFGQIQLFGQNPRRDWQVKLMSGLGKILPLHGAVRINQFLKLPALLSDSLASHAVIKDNGVGIVFEYLVVVCTNPKPRS